MNKKALFIFPILLICVNVSAQKAVLGLVKKVGSLIDSMSVRGLSVIHFCPVDDSVTDSRDSADLSDISSIFTWINESPQLSNSF